MKILKLILLTLLISKNCCAQVHFLKDLESAKSLSLKVTQLFLEGDISSAANLLRPYWPVPENELSNFETKTIQGINILSERFGKLEGIEKISERAIKQTVVEEVYLVKFEKSAIRLVYVFYKSNKGWILNSFKWDDNLENIFK